MAARVREFYAMAPEARARLADNGRSAYLAKYTRDVQARLLEKTLLQAAARGSR
jgi:hypothetical protein